MAPEQFGFDDEYIGPEVDVFSFGILLYEIITETIPYNELGKMMPFALINKIVSGYRPPFPENFPEKLKELINKCWEKNPTSRPSFEQIFDILSKDMSYFQDYDIDKSEIEKYIKTLENDDIIKKNLKYKADLVKEVISPMNDLKENFYNACKNGNIDLVKYILSLNAIDINSVFKFPYGKQKTVLHAAVESKNIEVVKLLLENENIDVNIMSIKGKCKETALHIAVRNGCFDIVELLLNESNIDINTISKSEYLEETALHIAVQNKNIEIVKLLLDNESIDANVKKIESFHEKSIFARGKEKYFQSLYEKLDKKKSSLIKRYSRLKKIMKGRGSHLVTYKVEKTALHIAIENGNIEIIKLLLKKNKIDVNLKSLEYIAYPIYNGDSYDYESTKLSYREEKAPLHIAVQNNNIEIVKLLLSTQRDIDVNINLLTKFEVLFESGNYDDFDARSSFLITDKSEKSLLNISVENENIDIIKLLLDRLNIDINIKSRQSMISKSILPTEFDFYIENEYSENTALDISIKIKNKEIVELLLNHNCINTSIESNGNLPLFSAVYSGDLEIIKTLLSHDVNINQVDFKGRKAIEITDDEKIKKVLRDYVKRSQK